MKIKIETEIRKNSANSEVIDVSIKRIGRVPQKYGALAAAAQMAITQSMRELFGRIQNMDKK